MPPCSSSEGYNCPRRERGGDEPLVIPGDLSEKPAVLPRLATPKMNQINPNDKMTDEPPEMPDEVRRILAASWGKRRMCLPPAELAGDWGAFLPLNAITSTNANLSSTRSVLPDEVDPALPPSDEVTAP